VTESPNTPIVLLNYYAWKSRLARQHKAGAGEGSSPACPASLMRYIDGGKTNCGEMPFCRVFLQLANCRTTNGAPATAFDPERMAPRRN